MDRHNGEESISSGFLDCKFKEVLVSLAPLCLTIAVNPQSHSFPKEFGVAWLSLDASLHSVQVAVIVYSRQSQFTCDADADAGEQTAETS